MHMLDFFKINSTPKALLESSISCHNYTKIEMVSCYDFKSVFNLRVNSKLEELLKSDFVLAVIKNEIILLVKDSESLSVISVE